LFEVLVGLFYRIFSKVQLEAEIVDGRQGVPLAQVPFLYTFEDRARDLEVLGGNRKFIDADQLIYIHHRWPSRKGNPDEAGKRRRVTRGQGLIFTPFQLTIMQVIVGIFFHFIGGFASGSFYMPYKRVKGWHWENYWIIGGLFSWLIIPPLAAWLTVPGFADIIRNTPAETIRYTMFFGVLWGVGGLTYGLGVRYLGMSLGNTVVLGFCRCTITFSLRRERRPFTTSSPPPGAG
jgi:hypothetical protein